MIKIIHLSNSIGANKGGGISAFVKDYMLLQYNNIFSTYLWFTGSKNFNIEIAKFREFETKIKLIGVFGKSNLQKIFLPQILFELKTVKIIHQHSLWLYPSFLSSLFSVFLKGIVIIQPHGALSPIALKRSYFKKKIALFFYENKNIRNASIFIANSINELEDIKRLFPLKKVALIPHGISCEFIFHKSIANSYFDSLIDGKKTILFLSRIHPIKGLDRLIEAISQVNKDKLKNVLFIIAGTGEINYINSLKYLINSYNLENYFIFTGYANKEDKIALLDRCSCFVLPSFTESFSLSIIEAMARGLPIITTKGTPWSELNDKNCGFWIDNSVEGILNGLNMFLDISPQEITNMGLNSKNLVLENYILEKNIQKLNELYKYLLNQCPKPNFVF